MDNLETLATYIELHDVAAIRNAFATGTDPNTLFKGEPLIYELTSEYTRSPRFRECVRAFRDYGLKMDDEVLLAVMLDDADALDELLGEDPGRVSKKYTLRCAYTPLTGCTLLHICAEFNSIRSLRVLLENGADVNTPADQGPEGIGVILFSFPNPKWGVVRISSSVIPHSKPLRDSSCFLE